MVSIVEVGAELNHVHLASFPISLVQDVLIASAKCGGLAVVQQLVEEGERFQVASYWQWNFTALLTVAITPANRDGPLGH